MANFIRGTDSESLKNAADSFAAANGGAVSSAFGETQAHHLFPIEVFGGNNPDDAQRARRIFVEMHMPDFDINDARFLQNLPSNLDALENGMQNDWFAALHHNGSGIHVDYNMYIAENFDEMILRVENGANFDVASSINDMADTVRSGLVNTDPAYIVYNLSHRDPALAERLRTSIGDERTDQILAKEWGQLSKADKDTLRASNSQLLEQLPKDVWSYDSSSDFVTKLADGVIRVGSLTIFSGAGAALFVTVTASAVDAHGSAALDLGSLALVSYGLYQDGVLDNFSIGAAVDLFQNSNIPELIGNSLDNLTSEVAIDAALTVAASALGVGLLWNGVQIVQSAAGFDAALSYAAERAPDGHVIQIMNSLVDGAKALFSGGGNIEAFRIANLIEQTDPDLAVAVGSELIGILSDLPTTNGIGFGLGGLDVNNLGGIISKIENTDAIFFGGATSLEDKLKYALGQSYLSEGNAVAFAQLFPDSCFGPEVPIDMWPLDLDFAPDPSNPYKQYDQEAVRAKIWQKPIEEVRAGDLVVSFDDKGNLVPGYVPRTFRNDAKILLNFHGTRVTPGHVYYRPDSKKSYKFETLIDVLRDDGVIQIQDGTLVRAATNVPVDTPRDRYVKAITGTRNADGSIKPKDEGRLRLGTRFIVDGKRSYAIADLIEAGGGVVGDDELIRVNGGDPMPFYWEFSDLLPQPEDFVLECSGTTLQDIYKAAEWESQRPHMPAPLVMDGGPVRPLSGVARGSMPRNEPLKLDQADGLPQSKTVSVHPTSVKTQ